MKNKHKTLLLTLNKLPFQVMISGEKREEFRMDSKWIQSRLFDKFGNQKSYDYVKFVNGYGVDKPYFICEFKGVEKVEGSFEKRVYSNGLVVDQADYIIKFGKIVSCGNLSSKENISFSKEDVKTIIGFLFYDMSELQRELMSDKAIYLLNKENGIFNDELLEMFIQTLNQAIIDKSIYGKVI